MISGLQKMTLLDYPGKVACTVFLQGCNFRCPFCHNSDLLGKDGPQTISVDELMTFLKKRVGLLDAVCITGGEPTLQKDLPALIRQIKALGYLVKLDTNGSRPAVLKALVEEKLIDYVAMDIKNSPSRYSRTAGLPNMDLSALEESIRYLLEGHVEYEFRTTVVRELHTPEDMVSMAKWIKGAPRYFLQGFIDSGNLIGEGCSAYSSTEMKELLALVKPIIPSASLRGVDDAD
jgi:pyruvate formate lyase activating enzyme